jgi:hypothetical protein
MDHPPPPTLPLLTPQQIHTYLRDGILVVDNLLSATEIIEAQIGLASTLNQDYGVDVHDLEATGHKLVNVSSTNGAGTCTRCRCFCVFATCFFREVDAGCKKHAVMDGRFMSIMECLKFCHRNKHIPDHISAHDIYVTNYCSYHRQHRGCTRYILSRMEIENSHQ